MLAALQKIRKNQAGVGRTPLLINVICQTSVSQELSSLHQLHVSLGFSLHKVKLCVLFMANSDVLLNCHVLFQQTYIQTPPKHRFLGNSYTPR